MRRRSSECRHRHVPGKRKRAPELQVFQGGDDILAVGTANHRRVSQARLGRHAIPTLHYQPKIDLRRAPSPELKPDSLGCHPTRGTSPARFSFQLRKSPGLILPIGAWVTAGEACMQAKAWLNAGLPLATMAVNVSSVQFRNEDFSNKPVCKPRGNRIESACS